MAPKETFQPPIERQPAIPGSELQTLYGCMNKFTSQLVAGDFVRNNPGLGVWVPHVYGRVEFKEGEPVIVGDVEGLKKYFEEDRSVLIRSGLADPVDNWAIEYAPTEREFSWSGLVDKLTCLGGNPYGEETRRVNEYLLSLGYHKGETLGMFIQEYITEVGLRFHALSWGGGYAVDSLSLGRKSNPISVFAATPGTLDSFNFNIERKIIQFCREYNPYLNSVLGKSFEYHHELVYSNDRLYLVQTRVACRELDPWSEADKDNIKNIVDSGVEVVIRGFNLLAEPYPDKPFVLFPYDYLNGLKLRGANLSNLAGLVVPKEWEGGYLMHGGSGIYPIAAYAFRWGIPVVTGGFHFLDRIGAKYEIPR